MQLSGLAERILGALIEKEMATPQSYPLSVNALRSAANQTTNRDPVTDYSESQISGGLKELSAQNLVTAVYAKRSSTPKYDHKLGEHLEIEAPDVAILSVLLLRGPQTIGEIRQRTERLHAFEELNEVAFELNAMAHHVFGALCEEMPRQPGQKETRWRHLLGSDDVVDAANAPVGVDQDGPEGSPTGTSPLSDGAIGASALSGGAISDTSGQGTARQSAAPVRAAASAESLRQLKVEVADLREQVQTLNRELARLKNFVGAN